MTRARTCGVVALSLALVACSSGNSKPLLGGTAGSGTAGAAGAGAAGAGASGATGTAGAEAGASGTAGDGTVGATTGAGGVAGSVPDGGAGSSPKDAATDRDPDAGPLTTAGCANHDYQLCIDFEDGIDTTVWSGGNTKAIVTDDVAHGTHAYHLYSSVAGTATGGVLQTAKVGTLTDQIWGRFYIHFSPGAPGGHGNMIAAYDGANKGGNWYEIGWQFDGIMGVWHGGGGENPLRSKPYIVDQWYCIELYFDGKNSAVPRWWIDSEEAQYYMPGGGPKIAGIGPVKTITVGWTPYAGLQLQLPDGMKPIDNRVLADAWIDDVAFDTQRIGCIE
ncbi:MAG TPA: hypothetical protein VH560_07310 [Polyangia bacterium]|jgi:hypothetical protein|nr:hypothetical protein [Polyangia bacterium]